MLARLDVSTRMLLSIGLLAILGAVAGYSTWGAATARTSVTAGVSTGTLRLELGAQGTVGNRLDVPAGRLAPGDSFARPVDLSTSGSLPIGSVELSTTPQGRLATEPAGLQLEIVSCSQPWTQLGAGPDASYSCAAGAPQPVLTQRPVAMTAQPLPGLSIVGAAPGTTAHLLMLMTLSAGADNSMQGGSAAVSFTFAGSQ
jgi:hypothetical protein